MCIRSSIVIYDLETAGFKSIQRRFTCLANDIGLLPYSKRLQIMNLTTAGNWGGGGAKYINVYPLHEKAKIYIYINIH